jgi:WD40 repeat protein
MVQAQEGPTPPLFCVAPRANGGHAASVTAADWFAGDNGAFVSCSKDGTAKLWDPNTATLVATFNTTSAAQNLVIAPKQPVAAVACDDKCIRLVDIAAGVTAHTLMGASDAARIAQATKLPRSSRERYGCGGPCGGVLQGMTQQC